MQNEYESTRIRLRGTGYLEDLSIEGLPSGSSDEIDFGQLDVLPNVSGKQEVSRCKTIKRKCKGLSFQNTTISRLYHQWDIFSLEKVWKL